MKITKSQRITISQIWNKVCKDRGWSASDRALRLAKFSEILGREITTSDDIGRIDECTKVMHTLNAMLGVSVQSGIESDNTGINRRRNHRWLIENEVLPCLELYPKDAPMGRAGAEAFLLKIMVDKSRWRKTDRPESDPTLADFDERTLQHIFWTLSARLNDKRKEAGDTGHEMRMAARVKCDCAKFCRRNIAVEIDPGIPGLSPGNDVRETSVKMLDDSTPDWGV